MTGAQFQREVGADAEKWADAFVDSAMPRLADEMHEMVSDGLSRAMRYELATWFRDAMDAALSNYKDSELEV